MIDEKDNHRIYEDYLKILNRSTELLNEEDVGEDIFSIERLEQYALYLATQLEVNPYTIKGKSLSRNLRTNAKSLLRSYLTLVDVIRSKETFTPAAEWFVDNFHIVEDQIREIKRDLPNNYYYELPKLVDGKLKDFPRVYAIALAIISHTDCRLDEELLRRFLISYQKVAPLSIGELWAIPITLRIALLERLHPLASRIVAARENRRAADIFADNFIEKASHSENTAELLRDVFASEIEQLKVLDRAYIVQLVQRLREQDPKIRLSLDWLEEKLKEKQTTTHDVIQLDLKRLASAQASVGNIIKGMRLISNLDWREFFESTSLVDVELSKDPANVYAQMDFETRDSYRHAIERIAKRSELSELEICKRLIEKSEQQTTLPARHIGYFLIGKGKRNFEIECGYRRKAIEFPVNLIKNFPTLFYICGVSALTLLFTSLLVYNFEILKLPQFKLIIHLGLTLLIAGEFSIALFNHYITYFFKPKKLPKLDSKLGIPSHAQSMVVIPTLFISHKVINKLVEALQIHFLANKDPNIFFALLGDYTDYEKEHSEQDEQLLLAAEQGIEELNKRYPHPEVGQKYFHLFLRKRLWNNSENKWIGWERKRGKIHEFNRLLRGDLNTTFIYKSADSSFLAKIKYVITLDSDTRLPRDVARTLIGTILHPLNVAHYDESRGRITQGYAILQPRVSITHSSSSKTLFSKIFSGNTGLDPYTHAVSDVYQDLFSEAIYTGKGLYAVDAFEKALKNKVPENTLLSHDLFESCYARTALVTEVELYDDFPSDFESYSKRQHRWTRGDWQLFQWLLPWVPTEKSTFTPNTLSLISRWKIFDNLRRSLTPAVLVLWISSSWILFENSALMSTLIFLFILIFPAYAPLTNSVLFRGKGVPWKGHLISIAHEAKIKVTQTFLSVSILPSMLWIQSDAILRVAYRKIISKRNLLEWVSFAQAESNINSSSKLKAFLNFSPIFAALLFLSIWSSAPTSLIYATPFILLWFLSPLIKLKTAQKLEINKSSLSLENKKELRRYARRTWHFFESFVKQGDNWLAPDNFQEDPLPVTAHRTSPTNIGLQLLASLSAHDLGYIGTLDLIERLERTLSTIQKMPKMNGHLFNWYDTQNLEPLYPKYISTVDSGNLAGHLLVLKQACQDIIKRPIINSQVVCGIQDTLVALNAEVITAAKHSSFENIIEIARIKEVVESALLLTHDKEIEKLSEWNLLLADLTKTLSPLENLLSQIRSQSDDLELTNIEKWIHLTNLQLQGFQRDIETLTPWVSAKIESTERETGLFQRNIPSPVQILRVTKLTDRDSELSPFSKLLLQSEVEVEHLNSRCQKIQVLCQQLISEMDFKFLFNHKRKIFVIGYNVSENKKDNSYYDLLASESRLASFMAIAKGDVPQEHWFRLGRQLTSVRGKRALISWTATMFEYLMPLLVMKNYTNTLLDQSYQAVIDRQIEYGKENSVPWGISEAGYNARDLQLNFQYGPFGVPGLGLKRGLSDDLVVSPYSTMLGAMVDENAALKNLKTLESAGTFASYGFYESIDYTPARLPKDQSSFILRSFMAHHQGMSLVALNNILNKNVMQKRFHSDASVRATQLLLQERIPQQTQLTKPRAEEVLRANHLNFRSSPNPRKYLDTQLPTPRTQLLSNGTYSVMITSAGSGYSKCGPFGVSRWREDATCDNWGQFFYIKNCLTQKIWSPTLHPTQSKAQKFEASFAEDRVDFLRQDDGIITRTEIIVSAEDNVELRRISLTNHSMERVELEVTSFMEVVLARPADDTAHPSFSNLFIQTEFSAAENALLATRRKRTQTEKDIWGFHALVVDAPTREATQYESDRTRFIGRGSTTLNPEALRTNKKLSGTVGAVLDPIFSLRQKVSIGTGETVRFLFATGVSDSREKALGLADKYHDKHIFSREVGLSWTKSQVQLRHLNITSDEAHNFQRLAGRLLYSDPSLRPPTSLLSKNTKTQSSLWAYGISGDTPIILVRISEEKDIKLVRSLLHAHEYLRFKGLVCDLVILNERSTSYIQSLQDELQRQIQMSGAHSLIDKNGGVFIRRSDFMPEEDLLLLKTVARVTFNADNGSFEEQITRRPLEPKTPQELMVVERESKFQPQTATLAPLKFFNGYGGFSSDWREYVILLEDQKWTPAPWINVLSNSNDFGFTISESGAGYTWSQNSRENRITPWSNDAVSDTPGEVIYIRDEDTGAYWSPTPLPIREKEAYVVKHSQGYTQFEHTSHGIQQQLQVFVSLEDDVKITRLRLKNLDSKKRNLSVTAYVEWVLGFQKSFSSPYVITEVDPQQGTIYAKNPYNNEFSQRISFFDINESSRSFTCDRKTFLGRNGNIQKPAGLDRIELSGLSGAGYDPCGALQTKFELAPNEEKELLIILGQTNTQEEARQLALKYRSHATAKLTFKNVINFWDTTLGQIQVQTPDDSLNALINRWLLYQTLSCRIWARSAFYQSGGAFGFRDQLQDVMALFYSNPKLAREHILRSASRQFKEGDVQHWWHPPTGRGVRTRCSDDLLWLPYVTSLYIQNTGDHSILEEQISFIEAPELLEGQDDSYTHPSISTEKSSLLDHCLRAIDRSLKVGVHGLPLMGSCDWNDGMSRVGHEGKGESVWVAWFLYKTLDLFIPYCEEAHEDVRVSTYKKHMKDLQSAVEENAWDGEWYRRAYFDNGDALGSAANEECQIDSLAQSWAVLSGAGDKERAQKGMHAVDKLLVNREAGLIKLFTPPFDKSAMDPGYIKGYLPGVRENGGQYTHAAIWTLMAFAEMGEGDRAHNLFSLINPINHTSTEAKINKYKVEPYVIAADVYGMSPHTGRGGWTWYTGSASWMYRSGLESMLGFKLKGDQLYIQPCVPKEWQEYTINYRYHETLYKFEIKRMGTQETEEKIRVDGEPTHTDFITLKNDGMTHKVLVLID